MTGIVRKTLVQYLTFWISIFTCPWGNTHVWEVLLTLRTTAGVVTRREKVTILGVGSFRCSWNIQGSSSTAGGHTGMEAGLKSGLVMQFTIYWPVSTWSHGPTCFLGFSQEKHIISQAEGPWASPKKYHYFQSHTAQGTPRETGGASSGGNKHCEEREQSSSGRMLNILSFQQRSHKYRQESIGFGNLDVRVKLWVQIISH